MQCKCTACHRTYCAACYAIGAATGTASATVAGGGACAVMRAGRLAFSGCELCEQGRAQKPQLPKHQRKAKVRSAVAATGRDSEGFAAKLRATVSEGDGAISGGSGGGIVTAAGDGKQTDAAQRERSYLLQESYAHQLRKLDVGAAREMRDIVTRALEEQEHKWGGLSAACGAAGASSDGEDEAGAPSSSPGER